MYDIIGDVHGCLEELKELLEKLGYKSYNNYIYCPPPNRTLIFVGDLVSRGPHSLQTLWLVRDMIRMKFALSVVGNHDDKILRFCKGNKVSLKHGDDETARLIENMSMDKNKIIEFISSLPYYLVLDDGKLIVVHASWKDKMFNFESFDKYCRAPAIFGPINGKNINTGIPYRIDWAATREVREYSPLIVCGHQFYKEPRFINKTCHIDTGCCFGYNLSCLRYPEMEIVQVKAKKTYDDCKPEILQNG